MAPAAPTAPPGAPGTLPPGGLPTYPGAPGALPTYPGMPGGLPTYPGMPGALPTYPGVPGAPPTYPVPTRTTARTTAPTARPTTTRPTPAPAPRCTAGPTGPQVLALVAGRPGIPGDDLTVTEGPYCAAAWQFTIVGIAGRSDDDVEPLLVVSTGRPANLRIVEAGADVCTTPVEQDAPPGIRVRACGS